MERYKARLEVKGYSQECIDYDEVFALVANLETIRVLISLASQNKWRIYQMDVKSSFLNVYIEEEVYIDQPIGYMLSKGRKRKLCSLRNLYIA